MVVANAGSESAGCSPTEGSDSGVGVTCCDRTAVRRRGIAWLSSDLLRLDRGRADGLWPLPPELAGGDNARRTRDIALPRQGLPHVTGTWTPWLENTRRKVCRVPL